VNITYLTIPDKVKALVMPAYAHIGCYIQHVTWTLSLLGLIPVLFPYMLLLVWHDSDEWKWDEGYVAQHMAQHTGYRRLTFSRRCW
jgi:hypothetical protein